jgi:hypothetical protein
MIRALLLLLLVSGCHSTPGKFRVGDEVIARNFNAHPQLNGQRVTVIGGLAYRQIKGIGAMRVYVVMTSSGELACQEFQLFNPQ